MGSWLNGGNMFVLSVVDTNNEWKGTVFNKCFGLSFWDELEIMLYICVSFTFTLKWWSWRFLFEFLIRNVLLGRVYIWYNLAFLLKIILYTRKGTRLLWNQIPKHLSPKCPTHQWPAHTLIHASSIFISKGQRISSSTVGQLNPNIRNVIYLFGIPTIYLNVYTDNTD